MTPKETRVYPDEATGPFPSPPRTVEDADGNPVEIRTVDEDDAEDVVAMYIEFDPADRAQGIPPSEEHRIRSWVEDLAENGQNVAAWADDEVVGHAVLVPDGTADEAHELAIFVLQRYQGMGIGTELIETLLGHGADSGVERVWLTVEPWNHAAIHLYEKVGFELCGSGSFDREYAIRLA